MIYTWILIDKKTGKFYMGHRAVEKPVFGNNGKDTKTHDKLDWIEWNKELPPDNDSDEVSYIYDKKKKELVKQ